MHRSFVARSGSITRFWAASAAGLRLAALGALLIVTGCDGGAEAPEEATATEARLPQVRTLILQPETFTREIRAFGSVEPVEQIDLVVDFSGTVRTVDFAEGYRIEAGETLIAFDQQERAADLRRAEAAYREAEAEVDDAQATFDRIRRLRDSGTVSEASLIDAEAGYRAATARVEQAAAERDRAASDLAETTLQSPVTGIVTDRSVEVGQRVLPGEPLGTVQTTDVMRVITYVTEREVNGLAIGGEAEVAVPGAPGRTLQGRIALVGYAAAPATGNFPVRVLVDNSEGLLRDGMTARVRLTGAQTTALLLPRGALTDRNRRRVAFRIEDGRAVQVEPVLAMASGDRLPVVAGLSAGDEVVVVGTEALIDGTAVTVLQPSEASLP